MTTTQNGTINLYFNLNPQNKKLDEQKEALKKESDLASVERLVKIEEQIKEKEKISA